MFFILSKILSFLFMPLSWIVMLLVASFFLKKFAKKFRITAIILLLFFSNSFIISEVSMLWEVPVTLDQNLDHYNTGVVLGGFSYYSPENDRITFRESGDRLFQGIRLYKTDVIKNLLISGGSGYLLHPELKESLYVGAYLKEIDISSNDFILESESRNTRENAMFTLAALQEKGLDKQPIVLITSAYHMRRAKACFEKVGFTVIPYSTDPTTGERIFTLDNLFLPNAWALAHWNVLIHEWMGYISYLISGYA